MITAAESLVLPLTRVATHENYRSQGRDPRLHLLIAIAGSVVLLLNTSLAFQVGAFVFLLVLLIWWRMSLSTLIKSLWPVLIMMALTVLYHLLFAPITAADYGARPLLYSPTLDRGLFYAFRLGGLYLFIVQFARLITTDHIADTLLSFLTWLQPLQKYGVPIVQMSLAIRAGISSIPAMRQSMHELEHAHQLYSSRSSSTVHSLVGRIRRFTQLIIPLLVMVIRRADHLTLAIRARGYRPSAVLNLQSDLHWKRRDTVEGVIIVTLFTILWRVTA